MVAVDAQNPVPVNTISFDNRRVIISPGIFKTLMIVTTRMNLDCFSMGNGLDEIE